MTAQEFVHRWKGSTLTERSASQSHFLDLCELVGHPKPIEVDKTGESFTFEKGADKTTGKQGYADVWKRGYFGWEYKGKHKDLDAAYQQLLTYREALENPPLLVVSDMERIVIHTNFTNTVKRVIELSYQDLVTRDGFDQLTAIFNEPESFKSERTTEAVTAEAAKQFAKLSAMLREQGAAPDTAAHFLIRLLFCLFAEDVGLLPNETLKRMIELTKGDPEKFAKQLRTLFGLMATGGESLYERIPHFNGSLFDNDLVLELSRDALDIVDSVSRMDWGQIEPSIFGTLFERSLDPDKRSQLGAHYTSKDDILLIVEPVLMRPLRRRWEEVRTEADDLLRRREEADTNRKKDNRQEDLRKLLLRFSEEIASTTVLDPACGSGNFLYVALRQLLDLEKEVIQYAGNAGLPAFTPSVNPRQLHGIEINPYAHELASTTIWIGYIQWLRDNGFGFPPEPILRRLDSIENRDAILAFDEEGNPKEAEWPEVDVIVGNPPFLGRTFIQQALGAPYFSDLRSVYDDALGRSADLCTYWFERSRYLLGTNKGIRVGLIATQGIRHGINRKILEKIVDDGGIFFAVSTKEWPLAGANVSVSLIGFDGGFEKEAILDGKTVKSINADLTSSVDVTAAKPLMHSVYCSRGTQKRGDFDIGYSLAKEMLSAPINVNGRPNSDVIFPYWNGSDLGQTNREKWIIDFGPNAPIEHAAKYEAPFRYVEQKVKPGRLENNDPKLKEYWWQHGVQQADMRAAIAELPRYIVTARNGWHRIFSWLSIPVLPDDQLVVFATDNAATLGILHSRIHETWALRRGSNLGKAPRYTPSTCFRTFPFPDTDADMSEVANAATALIEERCAWQAPPGLELKQEFDFLATIDGPWKGMIVEAQDETIGIARYVTSIPKNEEAEKELNERTLTNLYNERPTWLDLAHKKLDGAVFDAYGWPHDLTEDEILERLLALNLERAGKQDEK